MGYRPREIELIDQFIRFERDSGRTGEQVTSFIQNAVHWWAERELMPILEGTVDRAAFSKFGGAIIDRAVANHVRRILDPFKG